MVVSRHNQEQTAARSLYPELWTGLLFLLGGIGLLAFARFDHRLAPALTRLFLELGAVSLVTAAGFLAAFLTARARRRGVFVSRTITHGNRKLHPLVEKMRGVWDRIWLFLINIDWIGDWLAVVTSFVLGAGALVVLRMAWTIPPPAPPEAVIDELTLGILLALCFPLLVLERKYAGTPETALAEAPLLDRISRVPLLAFLLLAVAAGLRWRDLSWGRYAEQAVIIVTGLVAIELVLRSAVYIFAPLQPLPIRRSHADSFVAGLIRPAPPNFTALSASVQRQFGIDLARSWALSFIKRAMVPLALGIVLFFWLLTGVTALGLDERAVYESFGQPRAVLHSGLHLHWPWPFGILRPIEYGMVRESAVEYAPEGTSEAVPASSSVRDIEGTPPPVMDRLWDTSHAEATGYLVAATSDGRPSFEAVEVDLGVIWRIGLTDADAKKAAYNIAVPDTLIRSIASQMLARYFANTTTSAILGQDRQAFVRGFQQELQQRLSALDSGVDIMSVVVQGIHPPPKAATAYQGVQAAAIASKVRVNTAAAEAAREMKMAGLVANSTMNDATAAAQERINGARRDFTLFEADRKAYQIGSASFLFERRIARMNKGLLDRPLVIVDHRIPREAAPTVNLLPLRGGGGGGGGASPSDD
jgi:regulator of protease activity HflC (stomatin/prohibitin superfamily)